MKAVIVHGVLALFGLAFAYQTWTRPAEEEAAPGSVTIVDCNRDALQKVTLTTKTLEVTAQPGHDKGDQPPYWLTITHRHPKPAASKAKSDKANSDKAPDAGAAAAVAEHKDENKDENKDEKKPPTEKPKRLLASEAFGTEYVKRLTPLRAVRSLGKLPKDKDASFGFDKVEMHVSLQCGGKTTKFEVGSRTFGATQRYVRDVKTKTTYLVEEQLLSDLRSAQYKFMQSKLHTFDDSDIEALTVEAQGAKKRLLHRDRKLPQQALWVDAGAPSKLNELYGNWYARVSRLRVRAYLPEGAEPGSDLEAPTGAGMEPVVTLHYEVADKPDGKLELVRIDDNGVGHYYARTETTRGWVRVYDSTAKEVDQDVGLVLGKEQPPDKGKSKDKDKDKDKGKSGAHGSSFMSAGNPHASMPHGQPGLAGPAAGHPHAARPGPTAPSARPHGH